MFKHNFVLMEINHCVLHYGACFAEAEKIRVNETQYEDLHSIPQLKICANVDSQ